MFTIERLKTFIAILFINVGSLKEVELKYLVLLPIMIQQLKFLLKISA